VRTEGDWRLGERRRERELEGSGGERSDQDFRQGTGESDGLDVDLGDPRRLRAKVLVTVLGGVLMLTAGAWAVGSLIEGSHGLQNIGGASEGVHWSRFGQKLELEPSLDESAGDGSIEIGVHPKPGWASASGKDSHGRWAEFQVGEVVQRMRWIPAGTFTMGSPKDDPGRFSDEGPRHEVRLSEGYWMADTECTQALWAEVMDGNPSEFVSPTRPVEQVSWADVQVFIPKLNTRVPGLEASLPTEAQWERACRWESEPGPYVGPVEILGAHNAPDLDLVAWYGGNSGIGFELREGRDSSSWSGKQYPHTPLAGTHPVRGKDPNGVGLYDMLGNVWEWCADGRRAYPETGGVSVDPVGSGRERAVRGGSWVSDARLVRTAYRLGNAPGNRLDFLGFRLARGP